MLKPFAYLAPASMSEAVAMLQAHPGARILAGGTVLLAALERGLEKAETIIDLRLLGPLREITISPDDSLKLGALVTLREIIDSRLVAEWAPVLAQTARLMATPQVRNLATIGGNIGSGLPSADLVTSLLALDAGLLVTSVEGQSSVALNDYLTRTHSPTSQPGMLISAVTIPLRDGQATYQKIMTRKAADLPLANVAVWVRLASGEISEVRISAGGCYGRPARLYRAEATLAGRSDAVEAAEEAAQKAAETADHSGDWRASASYRNRMTGLLTRRALHHLLDLT